VRRKPVEHGSRSNVTISIPEQVLEAARRRALARGTSLNALLREYLAAYSGGEEERLRPFHELVELAGRSRRFVRRQLHGGVGMVQGKITMKASPSSTRAPSVAHKGWWTSRPGQATNPRS